MKTIKIRDTIGYHTTSAGFSKEFNDALDTGEDIELHINSPGGSVWHGWEIFNEIRMAVNRGATVRSYNMGLAASMASMILLAPKKENRFMAENSMYMIHNPKGLTFGEKEDMKKEIDMLGKMEDIASELYAKETGTSVEYMKAAMAKTSWYKPKQAKAEGFIGSIVDGGNEVEQVKAVGMAEEHFKGMPETCATMLCFSNEMPNMKSKQEINDLTKISNSQIREKSWKKFMRC